ncbi:hypothetical protein K431DRAFT_281276 [Polychaeton citri CBS 116435]|uniref:Apple domain-containing protein n=1 Tax=Polychaeton citri CBS 116435 TaxID=1314669 RepID=A0A9P4UR78_9PEZI|nr:hypothetical protein K431DRAFT_281276 [Polychaeton citri CBS 116435]
MHFFKTLALCPLAAQAAVLARQGCDATSTVTVTPSPITQVKEIYTNAGKATTTATRYALLASSSAVSSPQEEKKLKQRQCPSPTATTTITGPAETITSTATVTYTKAVRATATAAACQASNNYGLVHGTLNLNQNSGALPQVQRFADLTTVEDCCAACFSSEAGCMAWSFGGSVTNGNAEDGCVMSLASAGCPSVSGTEVIVYENEEKPLVGIGGCDVQVKAF